MSELATIEQSGAKPVIDPDAIDRRNGQPKQLSRRAKAAIRMVLNGEVKTHKAAAKAVNMNQGHFSEVLHSPAGRAFVARERSKTIGAVSMRAAARLGELVDADSEHVSLDAAKHVLAIEGIAPPDRGGISVNIQNNMHAAGYVVDLQPWKPVLDGTDQ